MQKFEKGKEKRGGKERKRRYGKETKIEKKEKKK